MTVQPSNLQSCGRGQPILKYWQLACTRTCAENIRKTHWVDYNVHAQAPVSRLTNGIVQHHDKFRANLRISFGIRIKHRFPLQEELSLREKVCQNEHTLTSLLGSFTRHCCLTLAVVCVCIDSGLLNNGSLDLISEAFPALRVFHISLNDKVRPALRRTRHPMLDKTS